MFNFNTRLNVKVVLNYLPFKFSFLTFGKICTISNGLKCSVMNTNKSMVWNNIILFHIWFKLFNKWGG